MAYLAYTPSILSGEQALQQVSRFDYIVPFPYCSNVGNKGGVLQPRLSVLSTMAIHGAVTLWQNNPDAKIMVPGESPFGRPDTGDLMLDWAKAYTGEIGETNFVLLHTLRDGRGLNNTYLQAQGLAEHATTNIPSRLVVPLGYHAARVKRTVNAYGMNPEFTTVEGVLYAAGNTQYDKYLPAINGLERTERIARLMTAGPLKKGAVPNLLVKLAGPRIVDIIEHDDGRMELENDTARKKEARLTRELGQAARRTA